jgi:hydrogenase maturation protein HypF
MVLIYYYPHSSKTGKKSVYLLYTMMGSHKSIKVIIKGIVQGVGFRPFIYNLAQKIGIKGYVQNNPYGVEIVAAGNEEGIDCFIDAIGNNHPPRAIIDSIEISPFTVEKAFSDFTIEKSLLAEKRFARISPDIMVCEDCIRELCDPNNRRYFYPFINCTNCGPRYTITADIPYDRSRTTMAAFPMCTECESEYHEPTNRRFHAQPNACHRCGPHLTLLDNRGNLLSTPSNKTDYMAFFKNVASLLKKDNIIALKGIGGFHFMCDAENERAVSTLRNRKYREDKPFAIMVKDIQQAHTCAVLSQEESERLLGTDRPIVLLRKKPGTGLAASIAPMTGIIGIMLPYTPVHYLLFQYFSHAIVMTSANISDEPIAHTNEDAFQRLRDIADYFIMGNRDILIRCDDSVVRIWQGMEYPLRRSRGIVPSPLYVKGVFMKNVLAVGAEQKNTICLGKENQAILSHHIGDLVEAKTFSSFLQAIGHLSHVFDCRPEAVAYDLHPAYLSTTFLKNPPAGYTFLADLPHIGVQHHHAHIASCMADNNISGKVIGVALDGTGYGPDATVWGGEILIADEKDYERVAFLLPALMPGGEAAIKKPWRMALSYLYTVFGEDCLSHLPLSWEILPEEEVNMALYQIKEGVNSYPTSSCGRLFDGIAALTGLRLQATYEGQPAIELEQQVDASVTSAYPFPIVDDNGFFSLSWKDLIVKVTEDIKNNIPVTTIAARFHNSLADCLCRICTLIAEKTGLSRIVLSGGCFMNMYLLKKSTSALEGVGLDIYTHRRVPCNDGGISLGQAVVANHRIKE